MGKPRDLNPMPQIRQMISMNVNRIVIDMNQCSKSWHYGIKNELKRAGYAPSLEKDKKVTYIKEGD